MLSIKIKILCNEYVFDFQMNSSVFFKWILQFSKFFNNKIWRKNWIKFDLKTSQILLIFDPITSTTHIITKTQLLSILRRLSSTLINVPFQWSVFLVFLQLARGLERKIRENHEKLERENAFLFRETDKNFPVCENRSTRQHVRKLAWNCAKNKFN